MKKIFYLLVFILVLTVITGCSPEAETANITNNSPLQLIDEVKDTHDNVLQQIYYNCETKEYWLKEYTYIKQDAIFICTDQRMSIISKDSNGANSDNTAINPKLEIYHTSELMNNPIVLIDNEYAKVSLVKYLAKDKWWEFGYEVKVYNKTNSVITVVFDRASIMDIGCKPLFAIDHIDTGDTSYFTLAWDRETIERCYIPYIDNIEFMVKIYNNENWNVPALSGTRVLIKKD